MAQVKFNSCMIDAAGLCWQCDKVSNLVMLWYWDSGNKLTRIGNMLVRVNLPIGLRTPNSEAGFKKGF